MVERDRWGWVAPALGILFVVLFVVITLIFGEGQDATDKTADEIVDYYQDHESEQNIAAILVGVAATALLFFAGGGIPADGRLGRGDRVRQRGHFQRDDPSRSRRSLR